MIVKVKGSLTIQEAMDNLAAIGSIDLEAPPLIGLIKGRKIITDREEAGAVAVTWLGEETDLIFDVLDATYRAIHIHLLEIMKNPDLNWDDEKILKGVATMMALVGESAPKMDAYIQYRTGRKGVHIEDRPEYTALQHFYQHHFAEKKLMFGEGEYLPLKEEQIDFERVKRDHDYELFYIHKEDGRTYYDGDLIRNLKLTVDFETVADTFEEDPLLKIRSMQDRDLQATAGQILGDCHLLIQDFYKAYKKLEENDLASSLSLAIMALFLANNPGI